MRNPTVIGFDSTNFDRDRIGAAIGSLYRRRSLSNDLSDCSFQSFDGKAQRRFSKPELRSFKGGPGRNAPKLKPNPFNKTGPYQTFD